MKNIFLLLFVSIGLLTSCVENPEEDPDPVAPIGNLQVDFDGDHFTSATTQVVIDDMSMSITGTNTEGAFFKITLPEAPIVGTYTWDEYAVGSPGFGLEYHPSNGSDPYVAARDDSGAFASFADYTDTAQLVITNIDRIHKRVSGTFKFTGVRFADVLNTAINTKVFTNGSFYSLPYTATAVVIPAEDVFLKKIVNSYPGAGIADQTAEYLYNGNKITSETYTDSDGFESITAYTYSGNVITKIEESEDGDVISREIFEYNASNKLISYVSLDLWFEEGVKETYVHNPDGTISVSRFTGDLDTQTDADGTSTIYFVDGEVDHIIFSSSSTISYTYDSKNNPFKNVLGFDKIAFVNGEGTGIAKNIIQSSGATPDISFTYTYNATNAVNYPATLTFVGVVSTFFYE